MPLNKCIIFGLHSVGVLLKRHPERIISLRVSKERRDNKIEAIVELAKKQGLTIDRGSRQDLDEVTAGGNHQGVAAMCSQPQVYSEHDLRSLVDKLEVPPFLLILDGVQDPHNLGACFRTAEAAGVHAIIAPKDKSVGLTAVVSKVASGAAEIIPFVQVTNLVRAMEELKKLGLWIFGAEAEAKQTIYQTDLLGPVAIVLGSEGTGLRRLTREHCDKLVRIPMVGLIESLNVSVATGIFLFEVTRQRLTQSAKV